MKIFPERKYARINIKVQRVLTKLKLFTKLNKYILSSLVRVLSTSKSFCSRIKESLFFSSGPWGLFREWVTFTSLIFYCSLTVSSNKPVSGIGSVSLIFTFRRWSDHRGSIIVRHFIWIHLLHEWKSSICSHYSTLKIICSKFRHSNYETIAI